MVALIFDAFVDPVIGELTDRTRSRWGRRLPWLYIAPFPLAFAWMALWSPPEMSDAATIAWLIGFAIIVRSAERCVGKVCVSTCRSRWSPDPENKHKTNNKKLIIQIRNDKIIT